MRKKNYPSFEEEIKYWSQNRLVIGVDEVGRGAFAGPIVAAAVVMPQGFSLSSDSLLKFVNDSKQVKPLMRAKLSEEIKKYAISWSVSEIGVSAINKHGIGKANSMVFRKVIWNVVSASKQKGASSDFYLLVDGFQVKFVRDIGLSHQKAIVRGDEKSFSIAAASIIAKVHRDNLMKKLSKNHPSYLWARNKGYGTTGHRNAIKDYGLTRIHRTAFCKQFYGFQPS